MNAGQDIPGRVKYGFQPQHVNNDALHQSHPSDNICAQPLTLQGSVSSTQVSVKNCQLSASDLHIDSPEVHQISVTCNKNTVHHSIPLPRVDPLVVAEQELIFKETWPSLTSDARKSFPKFAALYDEVKSFNLPNFLGAQKTVPSGLNLQRWESELSTYHDREICYFLRYGWPVGYHLHKHPVSAPENHASAKNHSTHVSHYIQTELSHEAIVGPFKSSPFAPWTRLSPLMTRPKRDSERRRVIVDMSFPSGEAVNDGINITSIYGRDTTYTLPSVQDLATLIQKAPSTAWLWKADLARAYRQLHVDLIDTPLLGFGANSDIYLDLCPSFGCRSSSGACQRVSAAVVFLMAKKGFNTLAFLDDFAGCEESEQTASQAYNTFVELAAALGLQLAKDKCQPPATQMQWLGYHINTELMYIAIPTDRLHQVLHECTLWMTKSRASRTSIQSIVGKLVHLANGVRHARKFTSRILATLRSMNNSRKEWTTIGKDFKADIHWFLAYSQMANGISLISPVQKIIYIECDSSLEGGGGISATNFFKWVYPPAHTAKYPSIHMLEAVNLLVAYRTLCPRSGIAGQRVVIATDNLASHFALMTGKTKDPVLGSCARELWLEAACGDHDIEIIHKEGTAIPLADALSRYSSDPAKAALADKLIAESDLIEISPVISGYVFFNDI